MFQVYSGPIVACSYECRWLDWNDPEHRIKVDASGVDVDVVWTLTLRHGHDPPAPATAADSASSHRAADRPGDGEHYDDFVDWPAGETLDSVAYAFARLLGLPHYQWLRWRDDACDDREWIQHGAVRVGG